MKYALLRLSRSDLFQRSIGETTDIVEKEMYASARTGAAGNRLCGPKALPVSYALSRPRIII